MKKIVTIFITLFILYGCIGEVGDSCSNTVPVITDVSFHDCNCEDDMTDYNNERYEFSSGDCFDYIIVATDCNLDMAALDMWWCYEDECSYYSSSLDQVAVENGYHLAKCGIMPTEPGTYNIDFQIEDREGHVSNFFEVKIEVR